jgi:PAS domain S-box-containing protein
MSVFHAEPAHDDRPLATLRYLAGVSALGIAYYATGLVGLSLYSVSATAVIWFPTAIALAIFVLFGLRYWPAVFVASVVLWVTRGASLAGGFIVAGCAVLETCAGAFLLVRVLKFRPQLDRVRDAIAFPLVAVIATALGATTACVLFRAIDLIPTGQLGPFWSTWWWTHLSGDLVVTPAILTVAHRSRMPRRSQRFSFLEAFALALATLAMVLAILARWLPSMMSLSTPPYYVLPMLLWAGLRFGPRGAALASLSTNIVAIVAQELGVGPFDGLLDLQSFVTISTVGTLLVSTLAIERVRAFEANERTLRFAHDRLEAEVVQRTAELTDANKALARRDELMRQATALARLGSFEYDLISQRMIWSEELYTLFGRDPKTFEPSLEAFLHSVTLADRQRVEAQLQFGFANLRTFELTAHIKRPDNGERTLDISICVFCDGSSRPVRVVGCCQDITERELAERHRAQLAQLVESSDDAIIGLTPNGTVTTWNFGAQEVFGYSASDMIGRPCSNLVTPAEREHQDQVLVAVRGGNHIAHHYVACVRKNGEVFPASVTTSAVLDGDRDVIGISKVFRDITSQQEVEAQLRASLHEKEVLLREIHHRVKNNLQVIASLLRLETSTSETAHQALVDSQNRIHSMAMIHQLLYQSKDFAHVDFKQYLLQLADRLGQAYGSSDRISITVRCTLGDQLTVDQAIPCALILNEVVTNALTHAFPDERAGTIDIDVECDSGMVTMVIRDDGIGIPVEPERTNGMGFRIVRTLATQLGGTLSVERDNGTVITVAFPLERSTLRKSRPIILSGSSA